MREEGAIKALTYEAELSAMLGKKRYDDLWVLEDTEVFTLFHVLVDYGALFRDNSLYVEFDSDRRKWEKPSTRWDQSTCENAAKVLILVVDRLVNEVSKLNSPPSGVERMNELIRPANTTT